MSAPENQEHRDLIGQPLAEGNYVAVSIRNGLYVCKIGKLTPKKMRVHPVDSGNSRYFWRDGHLVYPTQTILLDGPDASVYILKHAGL
jgi:hypothetical protein